MSERRYVRHTESLGDRLLTFAKLMRERANLLPPGTERAAILAKAEQADVAVEMDRWLGSSELKLPK